MIEFVKGQWYQSKATKRYFQCVCSDTGCIRMRQSGSLVHYNIDVFNSNMLIPASLIPDFNDAKAGDECFSVEEGICKIMHSNADNLIAAMNESGGWDAFTKDGKLEPESTHPLLFNSFAQFKAYWAEQALEMGGKVVTLFETMPPEAIKNWNK